LSRFWAWSLDQLALEDLPAVVAYVLGVTGAEKVRQIRWHGMRLCKFQIYPSDAIDAAFVLCRF